MNQATPPVTKQQGTNVVPQQAERIQSLLSTPGVKGRFEEILGKKAPAFISSIVSAVNANPALKKCDPMSVISSAAIAAAMDLPINPSLGFAHIVPYKDQAQFQMGWKGFVQLAMRSGQYKTINLAPVYEGQIKKHNAFTGDMEFDPDVEAKGDPVGYLLYFKLLNGFEKYFYMTARSCHDHGKRYSKGYQKNFGPWVDDFDSMALKTVAKLGLSKFGVLSIDMQKAIESDQGVVDSEGVVKEYPDAPEKEEPQAPKGTSSRLAKIVKAQSETEEGQTVDEPKTIEPEPSSEVAEDIPI